MPDEPEREQAPAAENDGSRFPELAEMQREIERRIADNRRFLERFLDEDFTEEDGEEDEGEEGDQEEL